MWRKVILLVSFVGMVVAVWPSAESLRDLTGEEKWPGQLLGIMHWVNTAIRPQPDLAPEAVTQYADVPVFGVNVFLEQEPATEVREQSLRLIGAAGFGYVRQQFSWEDIEIHGKGDFIDRRNEDAVGAVDAWAKYDHIVEQAVANNVEIIARIDNPPDWSRAIGNGPDGLDAHAPPDNFDDYGDFVATTVERYKDRITYFQLWNEPNIYPEWGNKPPDPEAFVELACNGYERAKQANPDAVILAAALAPTIDLQNNNMNDLVFLQRAYDAGYGDCFDIFSAQGYGFWSGPADQRLRPTVINYPHHLLLRDVMVNNGDAHKPIWISEVGWNSTPDGMQPVFGQVTETDRARYAVELYERAQTEWPWIGAVNYWFFKRATDSEQDQPFYYFRLMEPDFTPYPAWDALAGYANGPQPEQGVKVAWGFRPNLFLVSLAVFTFTLILTLAPQPERHEKP
ncbi:MAG: hypothetical protein M9941_18730 [Anaerolineae bacterium]|nr:hypothetical protein [Anaerolineae bacterium]